VRMPDWPRYSSRQDSRADRFGRRVQKKPDVLLFMAQIDLSLDHVRRGFARFRSRMLVAGEFGQQRDFLCVERLRVRGIDHEGPEGLRVDDKRDRDA